MRFNIGDMVENTKYVTINRSQSRPYVVAIGSPAKILGKSALGSYFVEFQIGADSPAAWVDEDDLQTLCPRSGLVFSQSGTSLPRGGIASIEEAMRDAVLYGTGKMKVSWDMGNEAPACNHSYKNYEGLTTRYEYCTKCDHKRNERGMYE